MTNKQANCLKNTLVNKFKWTAFPPPTEILEKGINKDRWYNLLNQKVIMSGHEAIIIAEHLGVSTDEILGYELKDSEKDSAAANVA